MKNVSKLFWIVVMLTTLSFLLIGCGSSSSDGGSSEGEPGTTGYTVTFETNGGSAVSTKSDITNIATSPPTIRSGFDFDGWFTDNAFSNKVTFPYTVTSNIKLYAKWEQQETPLGPTKSVTVSGLTAYINGTMEITLFNNPVDQIIVARGNVGIFGGQGVVTLNTGTGTTPWTGSGEYIIMLKVTGQLVDDDIPKIYWYTNGAPLPADLSTLPKYNFTETHTSLDVDSEFAIVL